MDLSKYFPDNKGDDGDKEVQGDIFMVSVNRQNNYDQYLHRCTSGSLIIVFGQTEKLPTCPLTSFSFMGALKFKTSLSFFPFESLIVPGSYQIS